MNFKREHTAMSQLAHPNIVKFYGLISDEGMQETIFSISDITCNLEALYNLTLKIFLTIQYATLYWPFI